MPWRCAHSPEFDGLHVEMWWIPTYLQMADNLTKMITPSTKVFLQSLETNTFSLPEYLRPRPAQRALKDF